MEYQQPAEGILLHRDFGDAKFYSVACNCGNPDDEIKFEVEAEDTGITVHVWTTVKTPWWEKSWNSDSWIAGLINGLSHRISMTWRLWTRGYLENESWTILTRQQALNFSETLKKAITDVDTFRNQKAK